MKKFFLFLLVSSLLSVAVGAQTACHNKCGRPCHQAGVSSKSSGKVYLFAGFREPALDGLRLLYSRDGQHWDSIPGIILRPEIGNDGLFYSHAEQRWVEPKFYPHPIMRDPSIVQGPDGTFHLVWTLAWEGEKAFGYASSRDLIHWSEQRRIPVMTDSITNNVWAPEVFYDEQLDSFLVIWSSALSRSRYTAADSLGINNAQRMYYLTTKDFRTFSKVKPYYDPGFNCIDGFLVKRAPGDYIFILKDNRKPGFSNLFCVFGHSPNGPFDHPSARFAPTYSEGPCVVKVGEEYLIYYDAYREGRFGAVSTRDFLHFTPADHRISLPAGHKHGTIITVDESRLCALLRHASSR